MPLSNDDRERIREEELVRLRAQEEFRRTASPKSDTRFIAISLALIPVVLILWNVVSAARAH